MQKSYIRIFTHKILPISAIPLLASSLLCIAKSIATFTTLTTKAILKHGIEIGISQGEWPTPEVLTVNSSVLQASEVLMAIYNDYLSFMMVMIFLHIAAEILIFGYRLLNISPKNPRCIFDGSTENYTAKIFFANLAKHKVTQILIYILTISFLYTLSYCLANVYCICVHYIVPFCLSVFWKTEECIQEYNIKKSSVLQHEQIYPLTKGLNNIFERRLEALIFEQETTNAVELLASIQFDEPQQLDHHCRVNDTQIWYTY